MNQIQSELIKALNADDLDAKYAKYLQAADADRKNGIERERLDRLTWELQFRLASKLILAAAGSSPASVLTLGIALLNCSDPEGGAVER
jgi:hypothetical protein